MRYSGVNARRGLSRTVADRRERDCATGVGRSKRTSGYEIQYGEINKKWKNDRLKKVNIWLLPTRIERVTR